VRTVAEAVSFPPTFQRLQRHTVRVLVVAQLLGACGLAAGGTAGALLAEQLTGSPAAAGLPLAMLVLGSGVGAVVVTRVMSGHGRRVGLAAAYLAGAVGAGQVVAAASVGAVAGPNLLGPAGALAEVVGLPAPTGLFLLGDHHIRLALLVLAVANLAMVGVMAVAPVHLHDHGAGMGTIGLVVSVHIAAMYLPSPVTGWLADVLGARVVAGMGALLLLAAGAAAAVAGSGRGGIVGALLLLGVGWNAGLIGGSTLLHGAAVSPSLRTRAEGLGELGMGAAAAVGGSGAGLLLATGGLALLGLVAAAPCLLVLAAAFRPHHTHLDKRLQEAVRDRSRAPYEAGDNHSPE
jgi:Major Facilitator Superfamily